jgi:predicted metal-binding protein
MSAETPPAELLICVKCKHEGVDPDSEIRPGAQLFEALSQTETPKNITIKAVECLSNCTQGCTIALRGPGRWSYVYGNFTQDALELVIEGATKYQATEDGLVPWRTRPEHFRKNCIARIPPLEAL